MIKYLFRMMMVCIILGVSSISYAQNATIQAIRGFVQMKQSAGQNWKRARTRDSIANKGWILTGPKASVLLRLSDGSKIKIGRNSIVQTKSLSQKKTNIKIQSGSILAHVKKLRGRRFEVSTVAAVVGVRGTEFAVMVDRNEDIYETSVAVHKGKVVVTELEEDKTFTLTKGKSILIVSNPTESKTQSSQFYKEVLWDTDVKNKIIEQDMKSQVPPVSFTEEPVVEDEGDDEDGDEDEGDDEGEREKKTDEVMEQLIKTQKMLKDYEEVYTLDELKVLKTLNLSDSTLNDDELANLNILSELEVLNLSETKVTDEGLVQIKSLRNLKYINLAKCDISDDGLVHLKALKNLEILIIAKTNVTDKGLKHLRRLKNLKFLDLANCSITDRGLKRIKAFKNLEILILTATQITDDGLVYLKRLKKLKELSIGQTDISDEGLRHIKGLNLKELHYGKTEITEKGIRRLKKTNPGLQANRKYEYSY